MSTSTSDWPGKDFSSWCWHRTFHHCCSFHRPPHLENHRVDWAGFISVFSAKFILEVCGAAGAVWGFSEVIGWRTPEDEVWFRWLSAWTFLVFLVRFYWHAKHWLEHEHDFPFVKIHHRRQHIIHFAQVFAAKLLLQVCGASGAIWGSSEVVSLRNSENNESWRYTAIIIGNLFLVRWVLEIMSYCLLFKSCDRLREQKEKVDGDGNIASNTSDLSATEKMIVAMMRMIDWNESIVVKFILEVCGGTGAVWGFSEVVHWRHEGNSEWFWRPGALVVGLFFLLRWISQTLHFVFDQDHHQHLVTEPLSHQKRTSVILDHSNLHVTASVRNLAVTPSMRALGFNMVDLNLEIDDLVLEEDVETPSINAMSSDNTDAKSIDRSSNRKEKSSPPELQQIVTNDTKNSSYSSCD